MLPLRRATGMLALVSFAASCTSVGATLLTACKSRPNAADDPDAAVGVRSPDAEAPALVTADDDGGDVAIGDGGNRFRDAEPKVVVDPDGPIDPACTGLEVAFATAVMSPRCAIGSGRAKQLRAALETDAGPLTLRQEAKKGEGAFITIRLVNGGMVSLTLPLSYSAKLPAFTVLAEDDRHSIFELEAPRFDVLGSTAAKDRPHFARIVLPPGGAAVATIAIETGIVKMLGRGAGSEAGAAPAKLARGRYVLHVGQLVTDVETGAPARVTWDLPLMRLSKRRENLADPVGI